MVGGPAWLALEVTFHAPARSFYEDVLDLPVRRETDREVVLGAGETDLILRIPGGIPRGGLHTHYALSIPPGAYETWVDQLSSEYDLTEHTFGTVRSLYLSDPVGNCVELGTMGEPSESPGVDGLFEIALEVEELAVAERFYSELGFEVVDRGDDRPRLRLQREGLALELWEPHRGLADARAGVHVDVGLWTDDPIARAAAVESHCRRRRDVEAGVRLEDPDGHRISLVTRPPE